MPGFAFEDFQPGAVSRFGGLTAGRDEIVAFARAFDPMPFHLDEEAARASFVGELTASGWHSCGLQMRMLFDAVLDGSTGLGAPGIEDLAWIAPVRPGERLFVTQNVLETRTSRSRPEIGLVRLQLDLANEAGEAKMKQVNWIIFARRGREHEVRPVTPLPRRAEPAEGPGGEDGVTEPLYARFFDDLAPGMSGDCGAERFTPEAIVDYARQFDPQPFHLDSEAAKQSLFGGLCASGWHTGAAWCKRMTARRDADCAAAAANGAPVPDFGPSPGFSDLKWLRPVFAGDTIRFRSTIAEMRPSRSRPGWGIVWHDNVGENQSGERVFSFRGCNFWSRRPT